jgi:hypothetical protein
MLQLSEEEDENEDEEEGVTRKNLCHPNLSVIKFPTCSRSQERCVR